MTGTRARVVIRCRRCGERFLLRGKRENGKWNTGFRQCICDNETDFDIDVDPQ
ncbi:hypothetical protein [Xylanibacillus composti]|uniref:Uncharacterized protein n=1 Tax=Xylanibacillus composti TaxID=1572762 RepID=A0A8J4H772_9BACL|nr:hypothetical protein [Xylanibacillus composti]GIQ71050.1 hypothetical protein XYCOK13_38740 [Xylanibacillus composti]